MFDLPSAITFRRKTKSPHIKVEVLISKMEPDALIVRTEEDSKPISLPRRGVKIISRSDKVATLSLTEATAIEYGLA